MSQPPATSSSPAPPLFSSSPPWIVHKFGGTSLAAAACYRNCVTILFDEMEQQQQQPSYRIGVVVSAMGKHFTQQTNKQTTREERQYVMRIMHIRYEGREACMHTKTQRFGRAQAQDELSSRRELQATQISLLTKLSIIFFLQ